MSPNLSRLLKGYLEENNKEIVSDEKGFMEWVDELNCKDTQEEE